MQLFRIKNRKIVSIEKDSFKLEKDIQTLVEENLKTLFKLEFVSAEFKVGDFRLDSLAFDAENNSFVIVEYKKGTSYSVVDQGYSYLSVMLNNKSDFILEYNEKTGKPLKRGEVDWTSSKVIFVSPSYNTYQRNSVNFRDVPFELWEIKKFEDGLIAIEQIKSTSNESIDKLSKRGSQSVISKVSSEVRVLSEEDHVHSMSKSVKELWFDLREKLVEYPDTSFGVTKGYISWKRDGTGVCFVHFRKKGLKIDILRGNKKETGDTSKGFFTIDDPKNVTKKRSWTWKSGDTGHAYGILCSKPEELNYVMFLLDQKYNSMD